MTIRSCALISIGKNILWVSIFSIGFQNLCAQSEIKLLILGESPGVHGAAHDGKALSDSLEDLFLKNKIVLNFTSDRKMVNLDTLILYDVFFLYDNIPNISKNQDSALYEYVIQGGGLVAVHQGITFGTFTQIPKLLGAKFLGHGTGEFSTQVLLPEHPVNDKVVPYTSWDESYFFSSLTTDRTTLIRRPATPGAPEPEDFAWVRTEGKGRVYYNAGGHDDRVWSQLSFLQQLINAILWASQKREVTSIHFFWMKRSSINHENYISEFGLVRRGLVGNLYLVNGSLSIPNR